MIDAEFHTKILRHSLAPEEYRTYRAALEWDLTDPIVIESAKDFKSAPRWTNRLTPYHHQVTNLITFCRRLPVTLLADDVGLGKTISAGLVMSELASRSRVSRILIVCPKLLGTQWQSELAEKFDIPAEIAIGNDLLEAQPKQFGAIITTYNSARLYLERLPADRFEMLVLDEAHKLRNLFGTPNPPQVALRFRKALEERRFRFVLMLTATPIQNRLWDLYSLVELLTVARGHENPFGTEGQFARRFVADGREQARLLKAEAREEFRSIVYGYMSRVRRGDAKLLFPDRVVQMHRVDPTPAELELIATIAKPIQRLNRLVQISILQALASSPDALLAQLLNMARNGTVPVELAEAVKTIVRSMPRSAKLNGLARLIEKLRIENPERWRLVVFTTRRETQTTIQTFLEEAGLKVGVINGESGQRNQDTLRRFWKQPPDLRVIVSTEAGSEGVNLQVANVLVNFDLPWNPMVVEQRIGRVHRLGSEHANVSIFNIMLRGTFEEYIVGRLMEKLQMASHAIGDLEALLQGSDIGEGDDDGPRSFEEQILELILAALAGKDVEKETRLKLDSVDNAKAELEREEATINETLGSMDGAEYVGPRAPTLRPIERSMEPREFTLAALQGLGVKVTPQTANLYMTEEGGAREYIRFDGEAAGGQRSTLYAPGSGAFQKLVSRTIATGVHEVEDLDANPGPDSEQLVRRWIEGFGARLKSINLVGARRHFNGNGLLRVRATVAHDAYERLVDVACREKDDSNVEEKSALGAVGKTIEDPLLLGINKSKLADAAANDDAVSEFSRFYLERREQETRAAAGDARKQQKLHDDFTPRLALTLVGLDGKVHRTVTLRARYCFETEDIYESTVTVAPLRGEMIDGPPFGLCAVTERNAPASCLAQCQVTGAHALRHLLLQSEMSGRLALPASTLVCGLSGKRILSDEAEQSAKTSNWIASSLLKTSALSGKRAEPEHFEKCEFTQSELLKDESASSELSGRRYRPDQSERSEFSGKTGHRSEFVTCSETRQKIAQSEAEKCETTGNLVRPGVLATCEETGKRVLPSELERCGSTGKRALRGLFVTSSVSGNRILRAIALHSNSGNFCAPSEGRDCIWSEEVVHPDDTFTCALTGLLFHRRYAIETPAKFRTLVELLDGLVRTAHEPSAWSLIDTRLAEALRGGQCHVEGAVLSPTKRRLAYTSQVKTLLGLKVRQCGGLFDAQEAALAGRIAVGKRTRSGWLTAEA